MDTPLRHQSAPLQGTDSAAGAITRVSYTHDAMIDLIIARPDIQQGDLAKHFGYSQPWVSRIMNSDAFLARLAARKADIVDPSMVLSIDEKFRTIVSQSADIVMKKLAEGNSLDVAFKGLEIAGKLAGYGARQAQGPLVQNNFVVALPPKAAGEAAWAAQYGGAKANPTPAPLAELLDAVEAAPK